MTAITCIMASGQSFLCLRENEIINPVHKPTTIEIYRKSDWPLTKLNMSIFICPNGACTGIVFSVLLLISCDALDSAQASYSLVEGPRPLSELPVVTDSIKESEFGPG